MARLESCGELTVHRGEPARGDEVTRRVKDSKIVITSTTPLNADVIGQAPNLELISVWSAGYDHVDIAAASKRGVVVCNTPGYAAVSVAEHAMALALALAKELPQSDRHVRQGGYDWSAFYGMELAGKTFGIVGTGATGSHIARLARCFGCHVLACTKHPSAERAARLGVEYVDLENLLRKSEILCLCAALTPETEGMIGEGEFALMEQKPILINVARGRLIDQQALVRALRRGRIRGAGLDVLTQEPPGEDESLLREEQVIFTPHTAAVTPESMAALTRLCVENVEAYLQGSPQNVVS